MNLHSGDGKIKLGEEELLRCVQKSQSGDRQAFAKLIEAFKEWVFFHLYRWLGNREEAQELAQEVFLKTYASLGQFRLEAKFSTWLFQIALNAYRDFYKKKMTQQRNHGAVQQMAWMQEVESVEQKMQSQQLAENLRKNIEALAPNYREAIQLRFLSELSYQDCADALGESLSSVKMRVARGVAMLKEKIEKTPTGSS